MQGAVIFLGGNTHSVYLVQGLPLFVRDAQMLGGLDGAAQLAAPNLQIFQLLLLHELSQPHRKLQQRETGFGA